MIYIYQDANTDHCRKARMTFFVHNAADLEPTAVKSVGFAQGLGVLKKTTRA
jgi:hypothetical protein